MFLFVHQVRLAQLDRAFGYGPKGRGFESSNARRTYSGNIYQGCFRCIFIQWGEDMYEAIRCIIVDILALLKGEDVSREQRVRGLVYVAALLGVACWLFFMV